MSSTKRKPRPVYAEQNALLRLREQGWRGAAETLRTLAEFGEKLRRRYENGCSYEWACTDQYERDTAIIEHAAACEASAAGLQLFLQTDPRGSTIYVCGPGGEMSRSNYTRDGVCLYFE